MDFISNLIKRPISLVLNDSSSSAEHSQSPTKLTTDCSTPSVTAAKATTPERATTPSFFISGGGGGGSSLFTAAMNTSFNANLNVDALIDSGHYCELPAAASTNSPSIPTASAAPTTSNNNSLSRCLQETSSCSSIGSPNNTSSAIGELLIQINDNLNFADYNDQTADQPQPQTTSSAELSPAATKPPANKMTPSPRAQTSTASAAANTSPTPSTIAAAGPTAFEFNSSLQRFCIDPVLEAGLFGENPMPMYNNDGFRKPLSTFTGIPAFDESNIPELSAALNADIEEQLRLTFEEGLIPTLTAIVSTDFNSTTIRREDMNNKTQLLASHETDTAVSSDNETYAECQSYQDMITNSPNELTSSEQGTEISEMETYRSALNTTSTNAEGPVEDTLNGTMANVPEIEEEKMELPQLNVTTLIAEDMELTKVEKQQLEHFEVEPMDVDISYTLDAAQHETHVTAAVDDELPKTNTSHDAANASPQRLADSDCTVVMDSEQTEQFVESEVTEFETIAHIHTPLEQQDTQDNKNRLTFSISPAENATSDYESPKQQPELEIQQSTYEVNHNKSIELLPNQLVTEVEKTAPVAVVKLASIEERYVAESDNKLLQVSVHAQENEEIASVKSANNSGSNLNFTLDMNSSCSSLKSTSSSNSSTFPVKPSSTDLKQFPRSPTTAVAENRWLFFENPENEENINTKKSEKATVAEVIVSPCSPAMAVSLSTATANLNETVDLGTSSREKIASPVPENGGAALNGTFDVGAVSSPIEIHTSTELNQSPNKENRRTFNIPTSLINPTLEMDTPFEIASSSAESDAEKRRTFNLPPAALNTNTEPMDIDDVAPVLDITSSSQISTIQNHQMEQLPIKLPAPAHSLPIPTAHRNLTEDTNFKIPLPPPVRSPPIPTLQKRPPIHGPTIMAAASGVALELLSAKEQTHSNAKDEKDVVAEQFATPSPLDDIFTSSSLANAFADFGSGTVANDSHELESPDDEFKANNNLILNSSDFDYLLTKGNNSAQDVHLARSSLLLKFDPLLGLPVPVNQPQQQQQQLQQILTNSNNTCLSPTLEEDEQQKLQPGDNSLSLIVESAKRKERSAPVAQIFIGSQNKRQPVLKPTLLQPAQSKKNARMSVDVIDNNDCNKPFENTNSQTDEKQSNFKMDELEKKIKNEVLKTGDIEKKLKDAEQREEALIKRITEKDKTISKMNGVIEAYEKAIAELIAEKEQLKQNYEKQLAEVTTDRDSNYHHLASLETTFSDLHVKYEKSKEMTSHLKASEESLLSEKRQNLENLRLQEQRYEKMKNHAMQQLEIANKKLESLTKEHAIETTKLKALLKKEEISRASTNEQLQQKSRENAELVKICDELINGQGS